MKIPLWTWAFQQRPYWFGQLVQVYVKCFEQAYTLIGLVLFIVFFSCKSLDSKDDLWKDKYLQVTF